MHVLNGHAKSGARLRNDILLDHNAAEVVRAEFERDLANVLALGDPRTLNVREIIKIDAAERLGAKVFMSADSGGAKLGVLGLEGPADEGGEALVLSC